MLFFGRINPERLSTGRNILVFSFYQTALLFFIYSFVGWCVEVAFVAVTSGKVVNRGFLNGPVCPIYGCGMLGVLMALTPIKNSLILLFIGGTIICSAVELFGGWILDKIFHMRWWDYSDNPFNIGGYVCLGFSIMWGMGVVFVVRLVHPPIMALVDKLPKIIGVALICISIILFVVDMIVTLKNLIGIKKSLGQLDKVAQNLNEIGNQIKDVVGNSAIIMAERAEDAGEAAKEKIGDAREFLEDASDMAKEKMEDAGVTTKEKFAEQMDELEKRRDELIEKIQKNSRHIRNNLPTLNKSGKSINIKEYINSLKRK